MKDLFSANAAGYAQFRPRYPRELFKFIYAQLKDFSYAWDVGTGNGQLAVELSRRFKQVLATDISAQQLLEAEKKDNIEYRKQAAEESTVEAKLFDLIACAQAIHWFDFEAFYAQVRRHLKPDGLFVAIGYGLLTCSEPKLHAGIQHLYYDLLSDCWDPERKYLDTAYTDIPFPFRELSCPSCSIQVSWTAERLCAYLETWSALRNYRKKYNADPLQSLRSLIRDYPARQEYVCHFPVFLRAGRLPQ